MLFGELLLEKGHVQPKDIEKALQYQTKYGGLIGTILLNMGVITEDILFRTLAEQLGLRFAAEDVPTKPDAGIESRLPGLRFSFLTQKGWYPADIREDGTLTFLCANPLEYEVLQYLHQQQVQFEPLLVTNTRLREIEAEWQLAREATSLEQIESLDFQENEIERLRELASEAPVINLVNVLMSKAVERGASDLHFEPYNNLFRVRFRIDGMLHDIDFLPIKLQLPIICRVKIISGMDIAESRRPQDGQISTRVAGKDIDIRVSTLPLARGESLVLRFLVKESISYELGSLGLEDDLVQLLTEDIQRTAGVILLTGPTGSGKTTTLYSCLNQINSETKKIITIEDPVEYQLKGINQIQVHPDIGYDFLAALRSILRQDPDVIMIGEIRDGETARVAMQSSLTGHLVFSTVHTNDAPTAYTRLIDLGLQEFLINSALISVIAQRLVRRLCPQCARPHESADAIIRTYRLEDIARQCGIDRIDIRRAVGCPHCANTGYKGRIGLMEYLRCDMDIQSMPKDDTFPLRVREQMKRKHIRTLMEDGLLKVIQGRTTVEEVYRVCG